MHSLPFALVWFALLAPACSGQEGAFSSDLVDDLVAEALVGLEEGADIILPESVPILVVTSAEASERRRAYTEEHGDELGFAAATDMLADMMFSEAMLGRYVPDEKAIYVLSDNVVRQAGGRLDEAEELLFPVLAHELVHAYDDQVYVGVPQPTDLLEILKEPERIGEVQAVMSLLEGRATYAAELACLAVGRRPLPAPTLEKARSARVMPTDGTLVGDLAAGLGNSVMRVKLVQYAQGRTFARAAHDFGGEAFFGEIFAHLPLSLPELEDFTLFLMRWAEAREAEEEAAAETADEPSP